LRAVLTLCEDEAVTAAAAATERWRVGRQLPLDGIPFGVKDMIETAGVRTTGGSRIYGDYVPPNSAQVVGQLQSAGAVLVGKLQTMEFAMGDNAHYGPTLNPWDRGRATGGSSSGSAVAVAARELPLALGTDTGGSIRVPSSFCGVTGLKPTFGRVSRQGVMPLSWSLDHVGPMARSAADLSAVFDLMSGQDPGDPYSLSEEVHRRAERCGTPREFGAVRVGIPNDGFFETLSAEVGNAVRQAAAVLCAIGIEVVEIRLPNAYLADTICWVIMLAEMAALHRHTLERLGEYGQPLTRQLLVNAQFIDLDDYLRALRLVPRLQRDLELAFDEVDALLVPGTPTPAPSSYADGFDVDGVNYRWEELVSRTVSLFNVTGVPALALPAGFSSDGLPLGVQVVGPPLGDAMCLCIGEAFQNVTQHHEVVPPLLSDRSGGTGGPLPGGLSSNDAR
jgi:aspartyl-tRNA(Asn)/glutamyl-tRNA(Gln) amidotransferase subunit A